MFREIGDVLPSTKMPKAVSEIKERHEKWSWVLDRYGDCPLSLQSQCRIAVRHTIGQSQRGRVTETEIDALRLPYMIRNFLLYDQFSFITDFTIDPNTETMQETPILLNKYDIWIPDFLPDEEQRNCS